MMQLIYSDEEILEGFEHCLSELLGLLSQDLSMENFTRTLFGSGVLARREQNFKFSSSQPFKALPPPRVPSSSTSSSLSSSGLQFLGLSEDVSIEEASSSSSSSSSVSSSFSASTFFTTHPQILFQFSSLEYPTLVPHSRSQSSSEGRNSSGKEKVLPSGSSSSSDDCATAAKGGVACVNCEFVESPRDHFGGAGHRRRGDITDQNVDDCMESKACRTGTQSPSPKVLSPGKEWMDKRGEMEKRFWGGSWRERQRVNWCFGLVGPPVESVYVMGEEVGKGHFGVVRECVERKSGIRFACKSIDKSKLHHWDDMEDIRQEIYIMKVLSGHDNILNLRAVHEDWHYVHLILELCEGGELFQVLMEQGCLCEKKAAEVFKEIVEAVAHCHRMGIMHRDLKPENILLPRESSLERVVTPSPTPFAPPANDNGKCPLVKLADFGLSLFVERDKKVRGIAGSPYYLAPEVLMGWYGQPADIWSLGVILYMMLSGSAPFFGDSDEEVLRSVREGRLRFEGEVWEAVSDEAKDLIRRMVTRVPEDRPTVEQVLVHAWLSGRREDQEGREGDEEGLLLPPSQRLLNLPSRCSSLKIQTPKSRVVNDSVAEINRRMASSTVASMGALMFLTPISTPESCSAPPALSVQPCLDAAPLSTLLPLSPMTSQGHCAGGSVEGGGEQETLKDRRASGVRNFMGTQHHYVDSSPLDFFGCKGAIGTRFGTDMPEMTWDMYCSEDSLSTCPPTFGESSGEIKATDKGTGELVSWKWEFLQVGVMSGIFEWLMGF